MMSEEERDRMLGKMIRQRKELRTTRNLLESKAEEMLNQVELGKLAIEGKADGVALDDTLRIIKSHGFCERCEWPTPNEILELHQRRKKIQSELEKLEERLGEMGHS